MLPKVFQPRKTAVLPATMNGMERELSTPQLTGIGTISKC